MNTQSLKSTLLAVSVLTGLAGVGAAAAQDASGSPNRSLAGHWQVTTRLSTVAPAEKGAIVTTATGAATGLNVAVNDDTVPTLGFTYFITDHWAAEAILGTSQHEIRAVGGTTNVAVHKTWVLPPVITLQYRFNAYDRVTPYIGAGVNYMDWYSGKDENGFTVKLKSGAGTAVQAGADIALTGRWVLNIDYKKIFYKTDAAINANALHSKVKLDPSVASLGIGYKF